MAGGGVHAGVVAGLRAGARYRYRLDGGAAFPDPYARFQPEWVHGPSEVIDPSRFRWTDGDWPGLGREGLVVYECHVGAMTPAGTFRALIGQLGELKRLGVTAIELMPVAECPGRWNWGYDGVHLFAPSHHYGRPDDLRRLVNEAHRRGLGVLLDVVYNHLGPDGNHLRAYSDDYFTDRHRTPLGDAINYDGPTSRWVRDYAIDNACSWLAEYHVDGLRLDATDAIFDNGPKHVLAELAERARAATPRRVVLFAEEARNDVETIRSPEQGGFGLDGVSALLLLAPETPLLFMGQEFAASASFFFFTDYEPALGRRVTDGRRREFGGCRAFADAAQRAGIPDPQAEETFVRSKLDLGERAAHAPTYRLYRDLIKLRRTDPVLAIQDRARTRVAVVGAQTLLVDRWHGADHRLLVANFGPAVGIAVAAEPLLTELASDGLKLLLSTARKRDGGDGDRAGLVGRGEGWRLEIPARTAALFACSGA